MHCIAAGHQDAHAWPGTCLLATGVQDKPVSTKDRGLPNLGEASTVQSREVSQQFVGGQMLAFRLLCRL